MRRSKKIFCGAVVVFTFFAQLSSATIVDLTTSGSSGIINSGLFLQMNPDNAAGSGLFDSFLRIQKTGIESGYNTDGKLEFNTKSGPFTHSLLLSAVPVVTVGGIDYREFYLDINQNSQVMLSLDELKFYLAATGNLTNYPTGFGAAIYDLDAGGDNWVKMNYSLNPGSGRADIVALVPSNLFGSDNNKYVYLYSKMGVNLSSNDGFEEWAVGEGGPIIPGPTTTPEPATICMLGFGGLALLRKRRA